MEAEDIRRLVVFSLTVLVVVPICAWLLGGFQNWAEASWRLGLDRTLSAGRSGRSRSSVLPA
jgi:hypothetical protein